MDAIGGNIGTPSMITIRSISLRAALGERQADRRAPVVHDQSYRVDVELGEQPARKSEIPPTE